MKWILGFSMFVGLALAMSDSEYPGIYPIPNLIGIFVLLAVLLACKRIEPPVE